MPRHQHKRQSSISVRLIDFGLGQAVIARYYDDSAPDIRGGRQHEVSDMAKTQRVLRPEVWRNQQSGPGGEITHARYMRPLCERISTGKTSCAFCYYAV